MPVAGFVVAFFLVKESCMVAEHFHNFSRQAPFQSVQCEDHLHLHPHMSNPQLWHTSLPLIVRHRCKRHKGLVATWFAIHWLIVLHAASGRRAFGMREIAEEAGVGRNELAGSTGYIQRLVDLGLLSITDYEPIPGLREPRPIYHIDLDELERQSLEIVPSILHEHQIAPPPRPRSDPRRYSASSNNSGINAPTTHSLSPKCPKISPDHQQSIAHQTMPEIRTDCPKIQYEAAHPTRILSKNVTVAYTSEDLQHELVSESQTDVSDIGTDMLKLETDLLEHRLDMPEIRTVIPKMSASVPQTRTAASRDRDMGGRKERRIMERDEEEPYVTPSHFFSLDQVTEATVRSVLEILSDKGILRSPGVSQLEAPPDTPVGQPRLPTSPLTLWQSDAPTISLRDRYQIDLLIAEYDIVTNGFGAYWVGRAILVTDRCHTASERPRNLNYLRSVLRRWHQESSWGSDRISNYPEGQPNLRLVPGEEPTPHTAEHALSRRATGSRTARSRTLTIPATSKPSEYAVRIERSSTSSSHPAIEAYVTAFGRCPNAVQTNQIVGLVADLSLWERVLTDWQANGWKETSVANMLDRYCKERESAAVPKSEQRPSVGVIHYYPDLTMDERERWIRRFHAAETVGEKHAVLERLKREHPATLDEESP